MGGGGAILCVEEERRFGEDQDLGIQAEGLEQAVKAQLWNQSCDVDERSQEQNVFEASELE